MPDGAAQPKPFQKASHVGEIPVGCGQTARHHYLARQREVQIAGEVGDPLRFVDDNLGGGRPREFQGAAEA